MKRFLSIVMTAALISGMALNAFAALEILPGSNTVFDPEYYAEQNPDVVEAVGTDTTALYNHYVNSGKSEGRAAYDKELYTEDDITRFRIENFKRDPDEKIDVRQILYTVNSVGGVSPVVLWTNNTGKQIKYITFTMVPYNAVDDPIADEISGKKSFRCRVTGPIESNNGIGNYYYSTFSGIHRVQANDEGILYINFSMPLYRTFQNTKVYTKYIWPSKYPAGTFSEISRWNTAWYNNTTDDIHISQIEIDYMDGTSETIEYSNYIRCEKISMWE